MLSAQFIVNNCNVKFILDTGSDINIINQKYVYRNQIVESQKKLIMWNDSVVKPVGEASLKVFNPKTKNYAIIRFVVVKNSFSCLFGYKTIFNLNLLTPNTDNFISKVETATINVEKSEIGDLGVVDFELIENAKPVVLPCRKVPIALEAKFKTKMTDLQKKGLLLPVNGPSDWCSQCAVVEKRKPDNIESDIRICLDPKPLNAVLKREHYKLPTLDDILPKLRNAKVFAKFDVKNAYWHIKLTEKASMMTTMNTIMGKFRWTRLPFGVSLASEVFQKRILDNLHDLEGTFVIADDIIAVIPLRKHNVI